MTIDGSSLIWDGTVTITNFTDPTTGVVTLTLTPSGGVGNLPGLVQGPPGSAAEITSVVTNTLEPGQPATATITQTSQSTGTDSNQYQLTLNIPQGATGPQGSNTVSTATDVTGSPSTGSTLVVTQTNPTSGSGSTSPPATLSYKNIFGQVYNGNTSPVSETGQATAQLASITVPAQDFSWVPLVFGDANITGTTNTLITLQATVGTLTGPIVAIAHGSPGATQQNLILHPAFGSLISGGGNYGKVPSGTAGVILVSAVQTAPTTDAWSAEAPIPFTVATFPVSL